MLGGAFGLIDGLQPLDSNRHQLGYGAPITTRMMKYHLATCWNCTPRYGSINGSVEQLEETSAFYTQS